MTTDATRGDVEQWHIGPCTFCGPNFLGTCPHRPSQGVKADSASPSEIIGLERLLGVQRQPAVIDIGPLVAIIDREMQRLRDQLAVERSAASSAREALVMCEARLAELSKPRIDAVETLKQERMQMRDLDARRAQQIKGLEKRMQRAEHEKGHAICERDAARGEANRYSVERDAAVAELERYKAAMGSATTVPPGLVPGSTLAVIEAYRLLCGHEPKHISNAMGRPEWVDQAWPKSALPSPSLDQLYRAAHELLRWLDARAPGGKP